MSGSVGYRRELREVPRPITIAVVVQCAVGSIGGVVLLLALPPGVFAALAPWLILFTCLIVGAQPRISRWLRNAATSHTLLRTSMSPATYVLRRSHRRVRRLLRRRRRRHDDGGPRASASTSTCASSTRLKTLSLLAANIVAGAIFVVDRRPRLDRGRAARDRLDRRRLRRRAHRPPHPRRPAPHAHRDRGCYGRRPDAVVRGGPQPLTNPPVARSTAIRCAWSTPPASSW